MNFLEIFTRTKTYWPDKINISDGVIIEEIHGFNSKNLTKSWDLAEQHSKGEWEDLMVWIIYKILHEKSVLLFNKGDYTLIIDDALDLTQVEALFSQELKGEGYESMLKQYMK
jgi:hypothetical protein